MNATLRPRARGIQLRDRGRRNYRPMVEALENRLALSSGFFQQANLVSDQVGVAVIQDRELVNAWGMSLSPAGGALWVSANATGVSTLYTGDVSGSAVVKNALTVAIPGGEPTGQVFNSTSDFFVSAGSASGRAIFIFATANGDITGWNPAVPPPPVSRNAQLAASTDAVYTGLAIGNNGTANFLYAADYLNGEIDVFDKSFAPATLAGSFDDPNIPNSYRPFNIQNLGGKLYVTYAKRDHDGDGEPDGGAGFVSVFDLNGNLLNHLASGQHLKAPWGLALAPADFGPFGGALLVGNHASGQITAFDPNTGTLLGRLDNARGKPIAIDGLRALNFGNGVSFGDRNVLYFTAGPDGGTHGLLGSLRYVAAGASASASASAGVSASDGAGGSASARGDDLSAFAGVALPSGADTLTPAAPAFDPLTLPANLADSLAATLAPFVGQTAFPSDIAAMSTEDGGADTVAFDDWLGTETRLDKIDLF